MKALARLCPRTPRRTLCPPTLRHASTAPPSRPQVIFSGIQPTGVPHLGNYLGALQQWVKLQNEAPADATLLYSIVDLHAITTSQEPAQLRQWRKEMLASLLAVGLDPNRAIIFHQSAVPAHSELMWILSCQASMGYLSRMTQWKSKLQLPNNAGPNTAKLKLGLLSYPVLQAADILVHGATHVPVGEDQAQHLEFARECAGSFNHAVGGGAEVLVPPDTLLSPAKRVMSLTAPTQKMSKSDPVRKSRILINDTRMDIDWKMRTALTDSIKGVTYDPKKRPGVSNLIELMWHLEKDSGMTSCADVARDCKDLSMKALKERVVDCVDNAIAPIRSRYEEIMGAADGKMLDDVAQEGAAKASKSAAVTMGKVREAIGLS